MGDQNGAMAMDLGDASDLDALRNLVVRVGCEAQAILDALRVGRDDHAGEIAQAMANHAIAIAEVLGPADADQS